MLEFGAFLTLVVILIAEMPAREIDEDILERGVVG